MNARVWAGAATSLAAKVSIKNGTNFQERLQEICFVSRTGLFFLRPALESELSSQWRLRLVKITQSIFVAIPKITASLVVPCSAIYSSVRKGQGARARTEACALSSVPRRCAPFQRHRAKWLL